VRAQGDDPFVAVARTIHATIHSKKQMKWSQGAVALFALPTMVCGKQQHQEEGRYEIAYPKVPYQFYVR
jgi:hypothetical protein